MAMSGAMSLRENRQIPQQMGLSAVEIALLCAAIAGVVCMMMRPVPDELKMSLRDGPPRAVREGMTNIAFGAATIADDGSGSGAGSALLALNQKWGKILAATIVRANARSESAPNDKQGFKDIEEIVAIYKFLSATPAIQTYLAEEQQDKD